MRSGRKFSTNPMSAMPGRLMSLTVISARDASDSDNSSSCSSSRWSSNNRATPIDLNVDSVLVIRDRLLRALRLGAVSAVQAAVAAWCADALLLAPPDPVLEAGGRQLDGRARVDVRLRDDHVLLVCAQRDLGGVELALLRHDHPNLLDARIVLMELLQPRVRELAHVGAEVTMTGGQMDLHGTLPRDALGPAPWAPRTAGEPGGTACKGASSHPPAEPGGQDLHLLTVLGHGPAGDLEPLLVQELRDALVGQRVHLVLFVDQALDYVLRGARRHVLAVVGRETA